MSYMNGKTPPSNAGGPKETATWVNLAPPLKEPPTGRDRRDELVNATHAAGSVLARAALDFAQDTDFDALAAVLVDATLRLSDMARLLAGYNVDLDGIYTAALKRTYPDTCAAYMSRGGDAQ